MKSSNEDQDNGYPNVSPHESTQPEQHSKGKAMESDQAAMPHTEASALQAIENVAKGVKTVVTEAVAWVEDKAGEMTEKQEDTGPYSSLATCAPSDLDVIATGVLPAMPAEGSESDTKSKGGKQDKVHRN
ncbi:unnamed protein product [Periconia digitata]|uniref:Uncharacterized protein n=1 Tax=Periconia digitata TaxID=1303443 RepID=A0A9W4UDW9_9PLEO|nr:unnamed protein product [Periconia digitata]